MTNFEDYMDLVISNGKAEHAHFSKCRKMLDHIESLMEEQIVKNRGRITILQRASDVKELKDGSITDQIGIGVGFKDPSLANRTGLKIKVSLGYSKTDDEYSLQIADSDVRFFANAEEAVGLIFDYIVNEEKSARTSTLGSFN